MGLSGTRIVKKCDTVRVTGSYGRATPPGESRSSQERPTIMQSIESMLET